ncbi:MAG TPA: undecaprenyldiphospho-muramoylpentapeptide beta-N-acetylglucosaminyltransferase [Thermoanaerobaculia bacterium]
MIVAGKTGGHIFPGIALGREIRARRPASAVVFVGTGGDLESRLVPEAGFTLETIHASGFVGKSVSQKARAIAGLPAGFFQARRLLRKHRARAVVGMGGYVTVPVLAAARSLRLPTVIHDSDAQPGLSTRLASRFATRTAVGVGAAGAALAQGSAVTGTPVRQEFFSVAPLDPRSSTRRLLVFGGSQGSIVLNRALAEAAPRLAADRLEVIHQTGERNLEATRALYSSNPPQWRLVPFLPRLFEELGWADLVVCRAGAMTLAELAAAARPSILIPFAAAAHGHQLANARAFADAGAAVVIEEGRLTGETLTAAVREAFSNRARLVQMSERARTFAVPDAARRLADLLFDAEATA